MRARICSRCKDIVVGKCDCENKHINTSQRGYGARWRKFRERVFKQRVREGKALCAMCDKTFGDVSPHADHIEPVTGADDPLFFDANNIQFLHPRCHGIKTMKDTVHGRTRHSKPRLSKVGGKKLVLQCATR